MISGASLREAFPFHLLINGVDCTFLLDETFTFSNVDPGGYEMASFPLPQDLPWVLRGMPVRLDCGTRVAWEGRVKEVQRSLGAKTLVQCEGYGARLKDQQGSMIFVDRDITRWGEPPTPQIIQIASENFALGSSRVGPDPESHLPSFVQAIAGPWSSPYRPAVSSWYDAGSGNLIDAIYYSLTSNAALETLAFVQEVRLEQKTEGGAREASGNLYPKSTGLFNPTTAYRYGVLTTYYGVTNAGVVGAEYQSLWKSIAVYGNHGLTLRGSSPGGLYTGDIVKWVAEQAEGIQPGIIEQNPAYIVPHAAYYSDVEYQQIIADMAKLVGFHWGVWEAQTYLTGSEEPRLDFRPYPGVGEFTAWCLRSNCETLDIREDLSNQYNVAIVTYSEPSGEEARVEVKVDNPILDQQSIKTRAIPLSLGISTPAAAQSYGEFALKLLFEQARVLGSATIMEPIYAGKGNSIMPAWLLKSGIDRLRIPDLPSADAWGGQNELPITRVECSGGADGLKTSIEFGQGPNLLEALISQLETASNAVSG